MFTPSPTAIFIMATIPILTTKPKYPATVVIKADSIKIILTIERGVAPIALRIPISLVRSFTTINMILPTPKMPNKRLPMPTNQISNLIPVKSPIIDRNSSSTLLHQKPLGSSGWMVCRSLSKPRIDDSI